MSCDVDEAAYASRHMRPGRQTRDVDVAVLVNFKDHTIKVVSDDWFCEKCGLTNPPDADCCNDCDQPRDSAW